MKKRLEALVKSQLLVWARENAGLSIEEAAKKLRVGPERLESWESGERRPTIRQLVKLGEVYKRPITLFYMSNPPRDFEMLHDFRRLTKSVMGIESSQLKYEIRRARERREIALELYEALDEEPPIFSAKAKLTDDPESIAVELRKLLAVALEDQISCKDNYEAFRLWRTALEDVGVLVFQITDVDPSEASGFSVSEVPLPVVVLNIKDLPQRRIFTMLHEFAHITLREGGLCDLEEEVDRSPTDQKVEMFTNRVAGAILIPTECILQEDIVRRRRARQLEWSDDEITRLAQRYRVSHEALLRRLLILGLTTKDFYLRKRQEFKERYERLREQPRSSFVPPYRVTVSRVGPAFIRLVLHNYYRENITASDLSEYLNVKLRHMGRIEQEVMGRPIEFGVFG